MDLDVDGVVTLQRLEKPDTGPNGKLANNAEGVDHPLAICTVVFQDKKWNHFQQSGYVCRDLT